MFMVLSKFEDCPHGSKTKDQEKLKKALFVAIIMFSEAARFRSILEAITVRIENCEDSSELESFLAPHKKLGAHLWKGSGIVCWTF
jgi:hypothetical protein